MNTVVPKSWAALLAAVICAAGGQENSTGAGAARGVAHPQLWPRAHSRGLVDQDTETRISELLRGMSLEEKVGQMLQADISTIKPEDLRRYPLGSVLAGGNSPPIDGDVHSPAQAWLATTRAYRAVSLEVRPGHTPIPILFGVDAVHGNSKVRAATLFPHNIGLGAAHDPQLIRRIGAATAEEVAAVGIDWAFGPTLALPQDARWGRTFEGYGQDPALVRRYAAAMVLGLQGEPGAGHAVQNGHVAASIKHFLGDGGTTNGIDQGDTDVPESELIRLHAAGYPPAIEAGAMTVMASYSSWQGQKMHGNASLLQGVLKQRMGFEGFVVSDWNGHAQLPGCQPQDCAAAALAGIDMYMVPDDWKALFDNLVAQVRGGVIPEARVDDAVRRILRVKFKLGLFDTQRPYEGRTDLLGAPAHRAVAREAVRRSLVLLKNNAHVLPLRANARVLVAGAAADDIGWQSGGWTLSWQGTGNSNADFPNGQSIYSGLAAALAAGGGQAELSADGSFTQRPDAAVVVFGETPYAEFQGDRRSVEYQPGNKTDLALLRKLHAQGIPVVAVFLSGRPMWVNPELNASDAFVAAWLPGSEGGGVADVLVGTAQGRPVHDFTGQLSFAWPASAAPHPQALFGLGYGLRYGSRAQLPVLSEASLSEAVADYTERYFIVGHTPAPWKFALRNGLGGVADRSVLSIRAVDAGGIQEGGRLLSWSGSGSATAVIGGGEVNLQPRAASDMLLTLRYRLDVAPSGSVQLGMGCGSQCGAWLDLTPVLSSAQPGVWQSVQVRLADFAAAGADLAHVSEPLQLRTAGRLQLTVQSVRLEPANASYARLTPLTSRSGGT
ncbi:MAG: exo 1,3/1,4-beta-D-glucan glucohydrolase [Steroidobacteraceae bacterium]